ncbi:hypothetical protein N9Q90_02900 [Gammaproteobacteria bacterium]|nr:hypothetical protein [Gammaproteobacteria bacterium]
MIEGIGTAIMGMGVFAFIGAFHDEKPDDANIGIALFIIALGLFIFYLA